MNDSAINPEDPRGRILAAADAYFRRYGYTKTTMAEIAKDCGMSAANLYRYFASKQDIAAALAGRCLLDEEAKLRKVVNRSELSAAERLERFVLTLLDHTHGLWSEQPRLNELVEAVSRERSDIVLKHITSKHALMAELIARGKEAGDFADVDTQTAAEAMLTAVAVFDMPLLMHLYSREEFQRKAREVVRVLLHGLLKNARSQSANIT